jgi:copper chaperone
MNTKLNVKGMHCKACDMLIEDALQDINVRLIKSSHKTGNVEVEYEEDKITITQIKKAIEDEGYKVK